VFEQHALAPTAFAYNGGNFPLENTQANSPEHMEGVESLTDSVKLDEWLFHILPLFSSAPIAAIDFGRKILSKCAIRIVYIDFSN
jgi:hypothetical protein